MDNKIGSRSKEKVGILSKIKRHSAVARGNFASMFREVEIPPLPSAVTRLIAELGNPDADIDKLVTLISPEAGISAKLIKTVNSPLFALKRPASNVRHAVTLLGFRQVKSIVLAYATMEGIPTPKSPLFDHEAFWIDSLLKAMFARSMAKARHLGNLEDIFTATLLNDVALPVLLTAWEEYYQPVIEEWHDSRLHLSDIERAHFGWDHAQAGAWIAHSWELPEETVCYIGAHNLSWEKIEELELAGTLAGASRVAALLPSIIKPDESRCQEMITEANKVLQISHEMLSHCLHEVAEAVSEIVELFELTRDKAEPLLSQLQETLKKQDP